MNKSNAIACKIYEYRPIIAKYNIYTGRNMSSPQQTEHIASPKRGSLFPCTYKMINSGNSIGITNGIY